MKLLNEEYGSSVKNPNKLIKIAVNWDRLDIAAEVLSRNGLKQDSQLEAIMTSCLMEAKVEFVNLLVDYGFSMQSYLTIPTLRMLYNNEVS